MFLILRTLNSHTLPVLLYAITQVGNRVMGKKIDGSLATKMISKIVLIRTPESFVPTDMNLIVQDIIVWNLKRKKK